MKQRNETLKQISEVVTGDRNALKGKEVIEIRTDELVELVDCSNERKERSYIFAFTIGLVSGALVTAYAFYLYGMIQE